MVTRTLYTNSNLYNTNYSTIIDHVHTCKYAIITLLKLLMNLLLSPLQIFLRQMLKLRGFLPLNRKICLHVRFSDSLSVRAEFEWSCLFCDCTNPKERNVDPYAEVRKRAVNCSARIRE